MLVYPGRFQPVHLGHVDVICHALAKAEFLAIAIVIKPIDSKNPFSFFERLMMIRAAASDARLECARLICVPVFGPNILNNPMNFLVLPPDREWLIGSHEIDRIARYRAMGEVVVECPKFSHRRSATVVRALIASSGNWEFHVTPGVASIIKALKPTHRLELCREANA